MLTYFVFLCLSFGSGDLKALNIERVKEALAQVEERRRVYERNAERVICQSL